MSSLVTAAMLSGVFDGESELLPENLRAVFQKSTMLLNIEKNTVSTNDRDNSPDETSSEVSIGSSQSQESGISSLTSGKSTPLCSQFSDQPINVLLLHTSPKKLHGKIGKPQEIVDFFDLGANMRKNKIFMRFAEIPTGVESYFQNRSQISRLNNIEPPHHKTMKCPFSYCGFMETHY